MKLLKIKLSTVLIIFALAGMAFIFPRTSKSQDWFTTGINLGAARIRLAAAELPSTSGDAQAINLTKEFNQVLWDDLDNSGIFDLVSKSLFPLKIPREPQDVVTNDWTASPASARMLIFGKTEVINSSLVFTGRLYDLTNAGNPSVIARRYVATMNEISTREAAHRFANEVIKTLGAGVPGIALTRLAFVSDRTGHDEIWVMDYDGFNQRPITSFGSLSLTPRWSPDNTKIAFTTYVQKNPDIFIFSLETNKRIPFPKYSGLNTTPAWSPDGKRIAFCSSMGGDPEIYVSDANGYNLQRLTFSPGVDISPVWNPKTGNEIAFVSDRSGTGSPQIYTMSSDGTNLRRLITGGGDAGSPSWSPNGLFIAFSWRVSETGTFDVYVIEIATGRIIQLTHDAGRNEHPYWSPDGRHLVFESNRSGSKQVWTMLADGSNPRQMTTKGNNWNPSWSN
ncbi:MAG TPA: Tol-Pal system beta propeller repeat protein TolB [Terriglobia bacterium]|nr:Tol-Pal system beta propeller repeat protein TolB [Terriglobia bacterium]